MGPIAAPTKPRTTAAGVVAAACALALLAATPGASAQTTGEPAPAGSSAPAESSAPTAPARGTRVVEARARPGKAYYFGLKKMRFVVKLAAKRPTDIRIDIRRLKSGALEQTLVAKGVQPGNRVVIPWDGVSSAGAALRGKFRFQVRGTDGTKIPLAKKYVNRLRAKSKKAKKRGPKLRFGFFDHIFPVRGKHSYGDGLGAPRAGHTHQGQDVSAKCGTKLVAAQGGTVQVNAFQAGGAGYYLVIDTVGSGIDHVYMHLAYRPALVVGQVVMTGQTIGSVGNTGGSSGCHLHYEMWSDPGWYEGGSFMDPTPPLRAWDKYS